MKIFHVHEKTTINEFYTWKVLLALDPVVTERSYISLAEPTALVDESHHFDYDGSNSSNWNKLIQTVKKERTVSETTTIPDFSIFNDPSIAYSLWELISWDLSVMSDDKEYAAWETICNWISAIAPYVGKTVFLGEKEGKKYFITPSWEDKKLLLNPSIILTT